MASPNLKPLKQPTIPPTNPVTTASPGPTTGIQPVSFAPVPYNFLLPPFLDTPFTSIIFFVPKVSSFIVLYHFAHV